MVAPNDGDDDERLLVAVVRSLIGATDRTKASTVRSGRRAMVAENIIWVIRKNDLGEWWSCVNAMLLV